ncbi:MAG: extracellular solute-binding protein [Candidatus Wallbacteria bacterium]|nr:extracellular solute-binding protein [Candidatus Wallbacteria bacterium]
MKKAAQAAGMLCFLVFLVSPFFLFRKAPDTADTLNICMSLGEDEWKVMREKVFPEFEKREGVKIRAVNIEAGDTLRKIEAMHKADRMGIDLLFIDNMDLAPYVEKRLVARLDRFRNIIDSEVYPSLYEPLVFEGHLMFFPGRPNVPITYYNTDVFDGSRYCVPQNWDELLDTSRRLKEEYGIGKVAVHGTLDGNTTCHVFEFIKAAGGDITTLDDTGCVKAFAFLQRLYPFLSPETKKANWNTTNKFLSEESLFLARNWPFGMNVIVKQNKKTNVLAYGTWAGPITAATVVGGDVIAITRRSKKHSLALRFAAHMMSAPVQKVFVTELGWPPVRSDVTGDVQEWQKPFFKAVTDALACGFNRPPVIGWSIVDKFVNLAFRDIVMEGMAVESTLTRYGREMREELAALQ